MIDKHLYMEDFLASTETETHITMLYHEIKDLMILMKLPMEKWATNSSKLKNVIQTNKEFHKSTTTVLGIDWDTNDDTLGNAFKTSFCVAGDIPLGEDLSSYEQLKTDNEARKPLPQALYVETTNPVIDITHYSSYTKLLRVPAWILRFLHNCKNEQRFLFELTAEELKKAKDYWILNVQQQCFQAEMEAFRNNHPLPTTSKIARFNPFLKNNQVIRLGGILQFAPISADVQHPLLLEANHPFVLLLVKHTHVRLHHLGTRIVLSELRSDFWILRGRKAIKKVLHKCLPCKLSKLKCGNQIEDPLPSECATTRALHIELVSDLSTDKFLLALQRFVGRRGLPCAIYTDNATTFHAANKELIHLWKVIT
ncbi:uncharacterized protein NPIL_213451 [Nephila pilipes]|uniref:Integrase zinc-binding domain-containing protein n=1 Tax=Nephila pilipes TaxID=299642 RepID=A0A8X6Q0H2_NEPPI|nr:uncharacterized protein NPIL_213451 [Nephila pilipes]